MILKKNFSKKIFGGSLIGAVNGLFGGGGGMIAVPALNNILAYSGKTAHATAILVIAPVCAVSVITYIAEGFFDASVVIPVTLGSVLGGMIGAKFLNKLPQKVVKIIFITVMLAAGIRMLWQ